MCLQTVESTERKPKAHGKGWKVFSQERDGGLHSQVERGEERRVEFWLKSIDDGEGGYPLGFHVFTNRKAAVRWVGAHEVFNGSFTPSSSDVIRQVKWRDCLAVGRQDGWFGDKGTLLPGKTIVAKEMMILAN